MTDLDITLAMLSRMTKPGACWPRRMLAIVCGVDHKVIFDIEQSALNKLRAALTKELPEMENEE